MQYGRAMRDVRAAKRERQAGARERAAEAPAPGLAARELLALQRTAGNQAVVRALQRTLYRGMAADQANGTVPKLGNQFISELGVRASDVGNNPNPGPGDGGASTSNARASVYHTTASQAYTNIGSHNQQNQNHAGFRWIWQIEETALPAELQTHNDHGNHVNIEAAQQMPLAQLQGHVQGTQASWTRSDPP
jgi:hypothetical protein